MYPKNMVTPPEIAVGSIYLIADGTIQTTGASVRVRIGTGAWGAGGGTLACDTTSGCWGYIPTQAETNADSFMVAVYKASSTVATVTVVTTATAVSGRVNPADGTVTAAVIADAAIDNATFAADVGSTAYATNIIALAVRKVLDELKLDHLIAVADSDDPVDNSIVAKLASTTADWSTFVSGTDSLEADRNENVTEHDATQAAIAGIGSGTGAALNFACTTDSGETDPLNSVSKVGTVPSATEYLKTTADNAVYEVITAAANAIDWVYKFSIGGGRVASKVTFNGYLLVGSPVGTKAINAYAYNFTGTPAWNLVGVIGGQTGTTDVTRDITLLAAHTGTGANAGIVYLRFTNAGAVTSLNVDGLIAQAQNLGQTVGYQDGCVWVDATSGTAGTTPYVNGTADKPLTTIANAYTVAAAVGLTGIDVAPGTTLTLTATADKWHFQGGGRIALGSQSTADAKFLDIYTVAGITTGDDQVFIRCGIGDATIPHCYCLDCRMKGDFTTTASQVYYWINCSDANESADTQTVIFAAGAKLYARRWSGALTVKNMVAGNELIVDGAGRIVIDSTCTGGTINIRGNFPAVTDNVVGGFTVAGGTITQSARYATDQINAEVDTALNTAIPSSPTSDSINERVKTMDDAYTATRAGYLDGLSTKIWNWLGALAGKTADASTRAEINATTAGAGYNETTDSLEANRDNIGTAGAGLTSVSGLTAGQAASLTAIEADTNELQTDWADGGRLDTLLDSAAGSGGGTGTYACTWTVNNGTTALQGATVSFWLNGVLKGTGTSAATTGQVSMSLDAATYTVAISLSGYTFSSTTHAVSATSSTWTKTFSMTAIVITAPTDVGTATGRLDMHKDDTTVDGYASIYVRQTTRRTATGHGDSKEWRELVANSLGVIEAPFWKSQAYEAKRGLDGTSVAFTVGTDDTFYLPSILGEP